MVQTPNCITSIPAHLDKNPDVIIVKEIRTPIVLEKETVISAMIGEVPITYGLPSPINTDFYNLRLSIAPTTKISDIDEFLNFKQKVLDDSFPAPFDNNKFEIKEQTVIFPNSHYFQKIGSLSVISKEYDAILKDKEGKKLSTTHFDENQTPYKRAFDIIANVSVSVYPNKDIANAILDGTLEWQNLSNYEYGYLRTELEKYEPTLGIPKPVIKKLLDSFKS